MPCERPVFSFWGGFGPFCAAACLAVACVTLQAQTETSEPVTDVSTYYQQRERFATPQPVNLTLRILYYDAAWRVLWAENGDVPVFLRAAATPMPVTAGQLVRVQGTLGNDQGLLATPEQITLLGTPGLPEPIPATDRLQEWSALSNRYVRVDAYIDRQEMLDENRARLHAVVHGRRLMIRMLDTGPTFPNLAGSFVTVTGVYAYTASVGSGSSAIEIWSPSGSCIQKRDTIANDPRFEIRISSIENLRDAPPNTLVRIVGAVQRHDPGRSLTVRDLTGQAVIVTAQTEPVDPGTAVEAIGFPSLQGPSLMLSSAQYRVMPADGMPSGLDVSNDPNLLRFVDQIHGLTPDEIASGRRASLSGVVTWARPGSPHLYLQDATGGIRVCGSPELFRELNFGAILRIQGDVTQGDTLPELKVTQLSRGADGVVNSPRLVSLDQALAGVVEAQWAELAGFLREIKRKGEEATLYLTTASGEFTAHTCYFPTLPRMLNSVIHVRGVCELQPTPDTDGTRVHLLVQAPDDLAIDAALPADLTALPLQTINQLHARGIRTEMNRWVRTSGSLTLQDPGSFFYLQEGAHSLRVLTRDTRALDLGNQVEVVGLLGREAGKQVLREARILASSDSHSAPAEPVAASAEPSRQLDGRVARVKGPVFATLDLADQRRVILKVGDKLVEARFADPAKAVLPEDCLPGAEVQLTGIYHVELNDYQQPRNFTLLLRTSEDIVVNRPAPWWTLDRALRASSLLVLLIAGAIVWVVLLRRRVQAQTRELLEQRDKEAKLEAELERSSRLESLGLLAGGIAHDFNNMLTVVVGNITLALMETDARSRATDLLEEAEKGALRARELTQQLLTFARGGDPVRTPVALSLLVQEAAEFALSGSKVGTEYDFTTNLPSAFVDKAQISQVVHNLVLHAAQSMPDGGKILFFLRDTRIFDGDIPGLASGTYLKLSITDSGPGIPTEHLGRIFDPYFHAGPRTNGLGLATVRSIVKRHQGHIAVTSRVNEGTTFTLWLPTAREEPEPEKPAQAQPEIKKSLRVLFMDDEEAIRRFAHNLLSRLGHDATTVSDGTEAVHAYAAAFEINKPYDVVVLDLTIAGGMGGREALEHLQNIDPNVRAIVSSGYSGDQILSDYRRYGFSGIVSKPYKIADLAQALQDVMMQPPSQPQA
jgi:two-component system, cell cycle sensor histidine kinase and response regulator CckA